MYSQKQSIGCLEQKKRPSILYNNRILVITNQWNNGRKNEKGGCRCEWTLNCRIKLIIRWFCGCGQGALNGTLSLKHGWSILLGSPPFIVQSYSLRKNWKRQREKGSEISKSMSEGGMSKGLDLHVSHPQIAWKYQGKMKMGDQEHVVEGESRTMKDLVKGRYRSCSWSRVTTRFYTRFHGVRRRR